MKKVLLLIILLLAFNFAMGENQQTPGMENLNLNNEQKEQLTAQFKLFQETTKTQQEKIKNKKEEIKKIILDDTPDQTKINTWLEELLIFEKEKESTEIDNLLKIKEIIGADNFKKYLETLGKNKPEKKSRPGEQAGTPLGRGPRPGQGGEIL